MGGGLTASVAYLTHTAPVATVVVAMPIVLEVIQDKIAADDPGVVSGGRSVAGYAVGAVSAVDVSPRAAAADGGDGSGVTSVTVHFVVQPSYVLNLLTAITPPLRVFSLMTAWLGLLGVGAFFLRAHMAAAAKIVGAPTEEELQTAAMTQQAAALFAVHESSKRRLGITQAGRLPHDGADSDAGVAPHINPVYAMAGRQPSGPLYQSFGASPHLMRPKTTVSQTMRSLGAHAGAGGWGDVDVDTAVSAHGAIAANDAAIAGDAAADSDTAPAVAPDTLPPDDTAADPQLPPGWTEHWSTRRSLPYFQSPEGEVTWIRPTQYGPASDA